MLKCRAKGKRKRKLTFGFLTFRKESSVRRKAKRVKIKITERKFPVSYLKCSVGHPH